MAASAVPPRRSRAGEKTASAPISWVVVQFGSLEASSQSALHRALRARSFPPPEERLRSGWRRGSRGVPKSNCATTISWKYCQIASPWVTPRKILHSSTC